VTTVGRLIWTPTPVEVMVVTVVGAKAEATYAREIAIIILDCCL
jgi:hypothetical protein